MGRAIFFLMACVVVGLAVALICVALGTRLSDVACYDCVYIPIVTAPLGH